MKFCVLYDDASGVFGEWYEYNDGWSFKKDIYVDLSEDDMLYLLKELNKVKKKLKKRKGEE